MYKRCHFCGETNLAFNKRCKRCNAKLNGNNLLSFVFAFSGLLFYFPANIYPIIETNKYIINYTNTIIDGIFLLWSDGDYPIAIIVFIASVLIPILKFIIVFYLLFEIKRKNCKFLRFKYNLYKFISISGHWSLLDVFVVVIISGLIHSNSIFVIPREGALYFLIMVIFTILSVIYLDLDELKEKCGRNCRS
ncbi:paraquat-inducible protein A [Caminibacter sp.]